MFILFLSGIEDNGDNDETIKHTALGFVFFLTIISVACIILFPLAVMNEAKTLLTLSHHGIDGFFNELDWDFPFYHILPFNNTYTPTELSLIGTQLALPVVLFLIILLSALLVMNCFIQPSGGLFEFNYVFSKWCILLTCSTIAPLLPLIFYSALPINPSILIYLAGMLVISLLTIGISKLRIQHALAKQAPTNKEIDNTLLAFFTRLNSQKKLFITNNLLQTLSPFQQSLNFIACYMETNASKKNSNEPGYTFADTAIINASEACLPSSTLTQPYKDAISEATNLNSEFSNMLFYYICPQTSDQPSFTSLKK